MFRSLSLRLCVASISAVLSLIVVGCGEPVREDRTIEFSRDGGQVAFQHDSDGVFVADPHGGAATKIFQPEENVLATSRPLASPKDGRLLFATAQPLDKTQPQPVPPMGPVPAEGAIVSRIPVRFTCWLRDAPQADQPAEVKPLFSATCGHVGYVSAGLAVRWHPDGKHVLYLASVKNTEQHSIFEFDLESEQTRRVFPHAGRDIIFDWTPNGSALVCVVAQATNRRHDRVETKTLDGIWIGTPGKPDSWWHVPASEQLSLAVLPSRIESLRASRPAWTRDDSRFAFVSLAKTRHRLNLVEFASREIRTVAESERLFADLHWSPNGQRLGFLTQDANNPGTLRILEPNGMISDVAADQPIRKFAGFDATGKQLAYVAVSPSDQLAGSPWWARLLILDPLAHDRVWIADADTNRPHREIFSGMRVTFPLWSPTEERLSLWLTFTPRYRSLLSMLRQWGLAPGDPAATIDVRTEEISWLAISPQEELQIGHFHLLKHNHAEAWRWYEQAWEKLPAARPPQNWIEFTQRIGAPENSQVFEFVCLKQLGRDDEAAAKWSEFDANFFPSITEPSSETQAAAATDFLLQSFGPQANLLKRLIQDLFVAEVFLSVDALDDAIAHFRAEPPSDESDDAALSRAIVLAQLLLIARDHDGYLAQATNVIRPLAIRMWKNPVDQSPQNANSVLSITAGLCLAPLFRSDFLSDISDAALQQNLPTWKADRDRLDDGLPAVAVDLVLRAAALRQQDSAAASAAEERINRSTAGRELFLGKPIDSVLAGWFN